MPTLAGTAFLALTALFFLYTAWSSGTAPEAFAGRLGLCIADSGGRNEIRSQYAGFFLAAAVLCFLSLGAVVPRPTAFVVLAVIFGGLIAGRLASLVLNKGVTGFGPAILALYIIDGFGFAAAAMLIGAGRGS